MRDEKEIELINFKVDKLKKDLKTASERQEKRLKSLTENQNRFYHWQNLEGLLDSVLYENEEAVFKYIEKNLGSGMLRAVLKKFIPDIKKELSESIERQLENLEPK